MMGNLLKKPCGAKGGPPRKTLVVIVPMTNPVKFKRRQQLFEDTLERMMADAAAAESASLKVEVVAIEMRYIDDAVSEEEEEYACTYDSKDDCYYKSKRWGTEEEKKPFRCRTPPTSMLKKGSWVQYGFESSDKKNACSLLLNTTSMRNVLWSKENLINIAIRNTIENADYQPDYFCWIDGDVSFQNKSWCVETVGGIDQLESRGGGFVQLFSTADLLGPPGSPPVHTGVTSFASKSASGVPHRDVSNRDQAYWHPGFAWGASRKTLETLAGGGDEFLICRTLGGADRHMAMAFIGKAVSTVPESISDTYREMVREWESRAKGMHLLAVKGNLLHYWHGDLSNRKYMERWDVLARHNFDPYKHMQLGSDGVLEWSKNAPEGLLADVLAYFKERDEDSDVLLEKPVSHTKKAAPSPATRRHDDDDVSRQFFGIGTESTVPQASGDGLGVGGWDENEGSVDGGEGDCDHNHHHHHHHHHDENGDSCHAEVITTSSFGTYAGGP